MGRIELNKPVVRSFVEEVVDTGHVERTAEFVAPGCIETDGKARVESGVAGMASTSAPCARSTPTCT